MIQRAVMLTLTCPPLSLSNRGKEDEGDVDVNMLPSVGNTRDGSARVLAPLIEPKRAVHVSARVVDINLDCYGDEAGTDASDETSKDNGHDANNGNQRCHDHQAVGRSRLSRGVLPPFTEQADSDSDGVGLDEPMLPVLMSTRSSAATTPRTSPRSPLAGDSWSAADAPAGFSAAQAMSRAAMASWCDGDDTDSSEEDRLSGLQALSTPRRRAAKSRGPVKAASFAPTRVPNKAVSRGALPAFIDRGDSDSDSGGDAGDDHLPVMAGPTAGTAVATTRVPSKAVSRGALPAFIDRGDSDSDSSGDF